MSEPVKICLFEEFPSRPYIAPDTQTNQVDRNNQATQRLMYAMEIIQNNNIVINDRINKVVQLCNKISEIVIEVRDK